MKKTVAIISLLLCLCLCLTGCGSKGGIIQGADGDTANSLTPIEDENSDRDSDEVSSKEYSEIDYSSMELDFTDRDSDASYSESGSTAIAFGNSTSKVNGKGAKADGADVTITKAGTYIISGQSSDAVLTVEASDSDKIQLVLNGLNLTCKDGPAVYIKTADKVFITLNSGTENYLTDGSSYSITDDDTTLDAALFSREDLTINGKGSLTVKGSYKHGIVSKDDLVITGGSIDVTAQNVGICGKDCVKISGCTLDITAGSDGVRSDNTEDADRGYVYINGGTLNITAENDGIQAETLLKVDGGTLKLSCGGGSANASWNNSGGWNSGWGMWGGGSSGSQSSESAKGLKAGGDITVNGGNITVDSSDDCLHSNEDITVNKGTFNLSSGDDGVHADTKLTVSGGTFKITKCYEGLEATDVNISGGDISVNAGDDGINAAGGSDGSSMGDRPGRGGFSSSTGTVTISGGKLYLKACGDAIDSNGTLAVTGGETVISGANSGDTSILDFETTGTISAGTFIGTGATSMAQNFSSSSTQGVIMVSTGTQSAGTTVKLTDSSGKALISHTADQAFSCVILSCPDIKQGSTYTLTAGSYSTEITMSSAVYGSSSGGMGGGMGGGFRR